MLRWSARSRASRTPRARAGSTPTTQTSTFGASAPRTRPRTLSGGRRRGCCNASRRSPARGAAMVNIVGEPAPDVFAGIDPQRVANSVMPDYRRAIWTAADHGRWPWTIVAFPTPSWAEQVFGEPDVGRLWDAIRATVRLDEADPIAAWQGHIAMLQERARADERAPLRRGPLSRARHRPDRRAARAGRLDGGRHHDVRGAASTRRTSRPRRSSRPRTTAAPRERCARRSRSCWSAARSCATSR